MPELEDLDISFNKIPKFDFSMFDQVGTLSMFNLNMSHNNLKELTLPSSFVTDVGMAKTISFFSDPEI